MSNPNSPARGLEGVVAATTRLSDVRGDVGRLIYCGYDIDELAGKVTYEEGVHLLHHPRLPTRTEVTELKHTLSGFRDLPRSVKEIIQMFPRDTPPMHALRTAVSTLGCFGT